MVNVYLKLEIFGVCVVSRLAAVDDCRVGWQRDPLARGFDHRLRRGVDPSGLGHPDVAGGLAVRLLAMHHHLERVQPCKIRSIYKKS